MSRTYASPVNGPEIVEAMCKEFAQIAIGMKTRPIEESAAALSEMGDRYAELIDQKTFDAIVAYKCRVAHEVVCSINGMKSCVTDPDRSSQTELKARIQENNGFLYLLENTLPYNCAELPECMAGDEE